MPFLYKNKYILFLVKMHMVDYSSTHHIVIIIKVFRLFPYKEKVYTCATFYIMGSRRNVWKDGIRSSVSKHR